MRLLIVKHVFLIVEGMRLFSSKPDRLNTQTL